jgi:hypothetical protein
MAAVLKCVSYELAARLLGGKKTGDGESPKINLGAIGFASAL